MRVPGSPVPVLGFAVPPQAPEPVAAAYEAFAAAGARAVELQEQRRAARAALVAARASDIQRLVEDPHSPDPQRDELAAEQHLAEVEARLGAALVAADQRGDLLATAIDEHRDEWSATLEQQAVGAAEAYVAALTAAEEALTRLEPARGGVDWLAAFDPVAARRGSQAPFHGGRLRVKVARGRREDARDLLRHARAAADTPASRAAEPEPEPEEAAVA